MKAGLFLFILSVVGFHISSAKNGYIFTMSRTLRAHSEAEFCLTVYGAPGEYTALNVTLINTEDGSMGLELDGNYLHGAHECRNFSVPEAGSYELLLYNSTEIFHDLVKLQVLPSNLVTFVQTDKPIYKPGQKVKFRILTLQSDLKPRIGNISSVYIKDPNNVRVKQYLDINSKGIASLEFQLSKEAKLGDWSIVVTLDEGEKPLAEGGSFKVNEYVLPRFEVSITPPAYILADSEIVEGKVCAQYTYGKPVTGYVELKICYGHVLDICENELAKIEGCYNFTANMTKLTATRGYYVYYGSGLKIEASVTEEHTGVVVNQTKKGPSITHEYLKLTLEDYTNGFFKPGLPFYGKVIVKTPDGQPAGGEIIQVTATSWEQSLRFTQNFTTDSSGVIVYALCDSFTANTTNINLNAEAIEYTPKKGDDRGMYKPTAAQYIRQWFSPSLSYIQIPRTETSYRCGDRLTLSVPFTTRSGIDTDFTFQVMARGQIIKTGQVSYKHQMSYPGHNLVQPPSHICLLKGEIPTPPPPPTVVVPEVPEEEKDKEEEKNEKEEEEEEDEENGQIMDTDVINEDNATPLISEIAPEPPTGSFKEEIVWSEHLSDKVSNMLLDFSVDTLMAPKFTLLIYYAREDGEVVADSMEFHVEPCFDNTVEMNFNRSMAIPGERVGLDLRASPGSVCGVGVVDKSVNILGGNHQVTQEQVFEKLQSFSTSRYGKESYNFRSDDAYCEQRLKKIEDESVEERTYWHYTTNFVDALEAFKSSGTMVLTNLDLETRPCSRSFPVYYVYDRGATGGRPMPAMIPQALNRKGETVGIGRVTSQPSKPKVRHEFPESWLWDIALVGESGEVNMELDTPHTVTTWQGNALCVNHNTGFGVSPITSITTFQPFFLSIHLPYAAVRGERLPIMLTVYNYLDKCINVKLDLNMGTNFRVHNARVLNNPVCVCGGKSHTARIYVTPTDIGSLPVMASAKIIAGFCDNRANMDLRYIGLADAVKRQMLVKAEGVAQDYATTLFMCSAAKKEELQLVVLSLPKEIVKDSARAHVSVIGDIMGPALTNVENLVRMPTGCGEQNMVGFVPNILVLEYLNSIGKLTEEIQEKAVKFMEAGYQRELNYQHPDGSYSAFGERDPAGSVWLTAFVVKSFAQAKPHIFIDPMEMDKSLTFLIRSQLENGCFRETGKVFSSYMMGGLSHGRKRQQQQRQEANVALTAYVLVALLKADLNTSSVVVTKSVQCIERHIRQRRYHPDTYGLALTAYAISLYDPRSRLSMKIMSLLGDKAKKDGSHMYWVRDTAKPKADNAQFYYTAPSAEVEMTAYALLAYINVYGANAISRSHGIAMWLSQQRNPYGGFSSTQDTVIGLSAMAEFAKKTYKGDDKTDMRVLVRGSGIVKQFSVSEAQNTQLLQQTEPIKTLPNKMAVRTSGTGCALVQMHVQFNKLTKDIGKGQRPTFYLRVTPRLYQHENSRCDRKTLEITVNARGNQKHSKGMSLLTLKMVTSWSPIPDSLNKLKSLFPRLGMKRLEYDESESVLTLYFDEFARRAKKFTIDVEQDRDLAVSNAKPAEVRVFQYYERDAAVFKSYSLKTICGTKAEIPRKRPEVIGPGIPIPVQQVRVVSQRRPQSNRSIAVGDMCPVCTSDKNIPEDLESIVCKSAVVYKAVAGRNGASPLKIRQDIRPAKKSKVNKFATFELPSGCTCPQFSPPTKRVLIFNSSSLDKKLLKLSVTSRVMPHSKKVEKEVRKALRKCKAKN